MTLLVSSITHTSRRPVASGSVPRRGTSRGTLPSRGLWAGAEAPLDTVHLTRLHFAGRKVQTGIRKDSLNQNLKLNGGRRCQVERGAGPALNPFQNRQGSWPVKKTGWRRSFSLMAGCALPGVASRLFGPRPLNHKSERIHRQYGGAKAPSRPYPPWFWPDYRGQTLPWGIQRG